MNFIKEIKEGRERLSLGMCHDNEKAASVHAKALLSFTKVTEDE